VETRELPEALARVADPGQGGPPFLEGLGHRALEDRRQEVVLLAESCSLKADLKADS
jgi:hypothetical protein